MHDMLHAQPRTTFMGEKYQPLMVSASIIKKLPKPEHYAGSLHMGILSSSG